MKTHSDIIRELESNDEYRLRVVKAWALIGKDAPDLVRYIGQLTGLNADMIRSDLERLERQETPITDMITKIKKRRGMR